ncbi:MAG: HlyC/CorC family transporter [Candidatus Omnitrophica bacterium]|nr:HlyC/CorC family transporter [Candidatus Omnitrophota bacterium]
MDIAIFAFLLISSAFFSASETAFLSLGKFKRKQIEDMDSPSARRVVALLSDPHKLLVTILAGNTLVNIAASAILADLFYNGMGKREEAVWLSIVSMTLIVLIFGEVAPKMFALANNERVSFFASTPLKFLEKLFTPIRVVLSGISYSLVKWLGVKASSEESPITEQEIKTLFSAGKKSGVVKEKEKDMIDSILEFKELNVADIMTPRIDVEALDLTKPREEIADQIRDSRYSRYPGYIHTLDNIVGIVRSKDFLLEEDVPVKDLVTRPFFVPESMKIDDLLQGLQSKKTHIAVVTDEYGVTSGIVTIEDVLEEIVGEIRDEHDYEVPKIRKLDQKTFEVDGLTHIDEVNGEIGINIETDEVDTIGGYLVLEMGEIPQAGDSIAINGFILTVNDVSNNRITRVTVERVAKEEGEGEEG